MTCFYPPLVTATLVSPTSPPPQLLTRMYTTYANIRDPDLTSNKERMEAPYDINLPIETLFEKIENTVEYTAQV